MGKVQIGTLVKECDPSTSPGINSTMMRKDEKAGYPASFKLRRTKQKNIFTGLILCCLFYGNMSVAQNPDAVYKENIKAVRFHMYGDQQSLPVYNMYSADRLELNFDDMDANVKSYYYCFQLCDFDWNPVEINSFLYLKGFTQERITTYRYSSIALTRYTHYQSILPTRNSMITLSGNYLLKVYLDGDTSKLVFTRRLLVLDQKAAISAKIVQPFTPQLFSTHQRIEFSANLTGLDAFSAPQQVRVVVLQNNRWDNSITDIAPTIARSNYLEYNTENKCIFPGGKEWRWLDLRSFRLQSDRVERADYKKTSTDVYLFPDVDRTSQRYAYFADLNGMYMVGTYETINPYWQGDFATVHFSLKAPNGIPYAGKEIYLAGQFTNFEFNEKTKMVFNPGKGMYECTAFLKQGYYNYTYIAVDKKDQSQRRDLEGDYYDTENSYTILMYYRSFTDRSDQLIGVSRINSKADRPGFSF